MSRSLAICLLAVPISLAASSCSAPPRQPPPPTQSGAPAPTIEGRWTGTFMTEGGISGGKARWAIDAQGQVQGSLTDTVWLRSHGTPRTGLLSGSCTGGVALMTVTWSTGQVDRFEGVVTSSAFGSMGCNLTQKGSDGNAVHGGGMTFDLHEAGVAAQPPFGEPAEVTHPDMLQRYVGRWVSTFSESNGDAGTGAVRIARDGGLSGSMVSDAFSDPSSGFPSRTVTMTGRVDADGTISIDIAADGATKTLQGKGYFETPDTWVANLAASHEALAQSGPAMTISFTRQ
jgi:hypothetical protein